MDGTKCLTPYFDPEHKFMKREYTYEARIVRVIDGDTVYADLDLGFRQTSRLPLRIRDLDTPEIYRPKSEEEKIAGMAARDAAKRLLMDIPEAEITIIPTVLITTHPDPGIYGRWSADITLPDGQDFATVMKELGHHVEK
jgi:endonuclease YncB( thermonuclease family)